MEIFQRKYKCDGDKLLMSALVHASTADNLHVVDLPYRLSSWAFDDPENIGLWTDRHNQLVAWAVLQTPFWTIDYAYMPEVGKDIRQHLLSWAHSRAQLTRGTPSGHDVWFVNVFSNQHERIGDLEAAGFACQAHVAIDPWSRVLMA